MDAPLRKPGEANAIDISGQRFGRLTAVKRTGRKLHGLNHEWLLLCDCGNIVNSTVHSVRSGNTNSCGCYGKDRITETQRLDVTGDQVGSLTAVRFSHSRTKKNGNKGQAYWLWRCDCGEELTASPACVRNRFRKTGAVSCERCGKKRGAKSRSIDLTGQRFGLLTAVEMIDENKGPALARWLWSCDCGNTCIRYPSNVRTNENPSCGCAKKTTAADRTGERFGSLLALRSLGKRTGESTYTWLFQCDCGKTCEARLRDAVSGLQKSCGCRQGGYDSIAAWLDNSFRNFDDNAFFYVFSLTRFSGYAKPGIAENLDTRRKGSRGEYGELHNYIECPRIDAWLVEQAVLRETRHAASCPALLMDAKWEGYSEVRLLEPSALFDLATHLHYELQELGREEFAVRYLVTTPIERQMLRTRSGQGHNRGA